ncbi:glycosyltransferase involved in cell wall biosynthesis [Aminivibrio pyruvatiphilus]|uniref:Glycosyltransferase involved in cell wall biosynthesis n=1 Tax=Aminivibrio pyruvatiphilus TaxID=1005740 RepID=A0A4R8LZ83_9BACT|nr:glycosyltransferase [Aminivibrio pyruvatiphilus]TDY52006.1 glycosyltransferase involved in cell wall biosynthesis [Aminivibrio pyruvatiphilus]
MKIALLSASSSIHSIRWANAFAERGHELHLISLPSHAKTNHLISEKVRLHFLPVPTLLGYYLNSIAFKKILREIKPDVMNAHYASGYGTLARFSGFSPYVLSVWGSDVYDFPYKSSLHKRIIRKNLLAADRICSTSKVMAEQVRFLCPEISRIEITPFGIDTGIFKPAFRNQQTNTITIGTVKTLAPKYGIDTLLHAFAYIKERMVKKDSPVNLRLMIVGGGPQERELKLLSEKLHISKNCTWIGKIPNHEVPKYLNQIDIYVALSRSESFGVAILEASACGLPVVVSDAGGLPEVVVNGVTGFVVRRESPEEAGEAIMRIVENTDLRESMGRKGVEHVKSLYDWQENVTVLERILQDRSKGV